LQQTDNQLLIVQSPRRVYNDDGGDDKSIFPPIKGDGEDFGTISPITHGAVCIKLTQRSSVGGSIRLLEVPGFQVVRCMEKMKARRRTIAGCCCFMTILAVFVGGVASWANITGSFEALEVTNDLCDDVIKVEVRASINNPSFMSPIVELHGAHFALESTKQLFAAVRAPFPTLLVESGGKSTVELPLAIEIVDRKLQGAILSSYHGPSLFSALQSVSVGAIKLATLNTSFLFGDRDLAAEEVNALDDAVKEARRCASPLRIQTAGIAANLGHSRRTPRRTRLTPRLLLMFYAARAISMPRSLVWLSSRTPEMR
jgi:hypothetical protein